MKNIVFVGFPCAGKTTAGRILAAQQHLSFVDLDDAIEEHYHITIPQLIQKYGEFAFRRCEQSRLRELLSQHNLVIATGGGAPCFEDAMQRINENATSIYLKISEETLVGRLKSPYRERPLAPQDDEDALRRYVHETLSQRAPFYEQAHITITENQLGDKEGMVDLFAKLHIY